MESEPALLTISLVLLNFGKHKNAPEGFLEHRLLGISSSISDSEGLSRGLRMYIYHKF